MAKLIIMEAVNLFIGNSTESHHFDIMEWTIPPFKMKTSEHSPGGAAMAINLTMNMLEPIEPSFKLVGMNPEVIAQFATEKPIPLTFRGALRNKVTGILSKCVMTSNGVITDVEVDEFKRGDISSTKFTQKEVWNFSLEIDDVKMIYADFLSNDFYVGGQNRFADVNSILGIS